jgi:hypothetical protein
MGRVKRVGNLRRRREETRQPRSSGGVRIDRRAVRKSDEVTHCPESRKLGLSREGIATCERTGDEYVPQEPPGSLDPVVGHSVLRVFVQPGSESGPDGFDAFRGFQFIDPDRGLCFDATLGHRAPGKVAGGVS